MKISVSSLDPRVGTTNCLTQFSAVSGIRICMDLNCWSAGSDPGGKNYLKKSKTVKFYNFWLSNLWIRNQIRIRIDLNFKMLDPKSVTHSNQCGSTNTGCPDTYMLWSSEKGSFLVLWCHLFVVQCGENGWKPGGESWVYSSTQCCGSGMFIYPGSWFLSIPDPKTATKEMGEKMFVATNVTKLKLFYFWTCE